MELLMNLWKCLLSTLKLNYFSYCTWKFSHFVQETLEGNVQWNKQEMLCKTKNFFIPRPIIPVTREYFIDVIKFRYDTQIEWGKNSRQKEKLPKLKFCVCAWIKYLSTYGKLSCYSLYSAAGFQHLIVKF